MTLEFSPLETSPMCDPEKEAKILGTVLYSVECAKAMVAECTVDDFSDPLHRECFQAIESILTGQTKAPLNAYGIGDIVREDAAQRIRAIEDRFGREPAVPETVRWDAKILGECTEKRWMRAIGLDFVSASARKDTLAANDIADLRQRVLDRQVRHNRGTSVTLQQALKDAYQEAENWEEDSPNRIYTGFRHLDQRCGPVPCTWEVLIAGRPSMGKTVLTTDVAFNIASGTPRREISPGVFAPGRPVLFVTLEMSIAEIVRTVLAPIAKVNSRLFTQGPRRELDLRLPDIRRGVKEIYGVPMSFLGPPAGLSEIRRAAQDMIAAHGTSLGGIFVDRVEKVSEVQRSRSEGDKRHALGYVSGGLHAIANELQSPMFLVAQLNRECEKRDDKRPKLSDIRDTGALEENAQRVIGIYRDDYYDRNSEDKGITEILILKNKGPVGRVPIRFNAEFPQFHDMGEDEFRAWQARHS